MPGSNDLSQRLNTKKTLSTRLCSYFLYFALLLVSHRVSAEQADRQYYRYDDGLLSAFVAQVTIEEALKKICNLTDIKLQAYGDLSTELSLSFHDLSLTEVFKKIADNRSIVIIYDTDKKSGIAELFIYAGNTNSKDSYRRVPDYIFDELQWIDYLAKRPEQEAIGELGLLLSETDKDLHVKQHAIEALSYYSSERIADALALGLYDQRHEVRTDIIHALEHVNDAKSLNLLAQIFYGDSNKALRLLAIKKMSSFNSPAAKAYLESALNHEDEKIQLEARYALDGMLPD